MLAENRPLFVLSKFPLNMLNQPQDQDQVFCEVLDIVSHAGESALTGRYIAATGISYST